jgi:hypothetical protein
MNYVTNKPYITGEAGCKRGRAQESLQESTISNNPGHWTTLNCIAVTLRNETKSFFSHSALSLLLLFNVIVKFSLA